MNKITLFYLLLAVLFLQNCDSAKRGLGGGKLKSSDEFLVEKKDPLVLPPNFNELPEPNIKNNEVKEDETDIEKIMEIQENNNQSSDSDSINSLEKSILKKIK